VDAQRIVSFLPSATEIVCALGLSERLVGVTHECDHPPQVRAKPVVVRSAIAVETMGLAEIDAAVRERVRDGRSLYEVDERLVRELAPDLILTQELCQVCAPSGNEVSQLLRSLPHQPRILWLTPKSIGEIFDNVRAVGQATGRTREADRLIGESRARLSRVAARLNGAGRRPRVFFMEWLEPVYGAGHWVPEMVELAGGVDVLGRKHADSVRVDWAEVLRQAPEVLVIGPCGFDLGKSARAAERLPTLPGWDELPAVRDRRVFAVDANSYFARPGPRVVDGVELLASLFHPGLAAWTGRGDAWERLPRPVGVEITDA
jgi:iron complex transport system substrate-binding protein